MAVDITARKQAEEALRKHNTTLERKLAERTVLTEWRGSQVQTLALQLTKAEETERRRIAGLLHDELQQLLVAAKLHLQGLNRSIGGDPRAGTIAQRVQQLIDEAIRTARGLSRIVERIGFLGGDLQIDSAPGPGEPFYAEHSLGRADRVVARKTDIPR
jgi:signal transduction histidine kinase